MKVLLSIKPQYVEKIFEGEKRFEYRRSLFKRQDIDTIVVYATKPVGKVIGEFTIDEVLQGTPQFIWEKTKQYSGIDEKDYVEYFKEKDKGFAIAIKNTLIYQQPLELLELDPKIKCAPQSFRYI